MWLLRNLHVFPLCICLAWRPQFLCQHSSSPPFPTTIWKQLREQALCSDKISRGVEIISTLEKLVFFTQQSQKGCLHSVSQVQS